MAQEVADRTNRPFRFVRGLALAAAVVLAVVTGQRLLSTSDGGAGNEEGSALFSCASGPGAFGHRGADSEAILKAPRPVLEKAGRPSRGVPLEAGDGYRWFARSVARDVAVWSSPHPRNFEIGGLRLGAVVRVNPVSGTERCAGGWFRVEPRGYVCMAHGLRIDRSVPEPTQVLAAPARNADLPFRYVHVFDRGAYLYDEPPSSEQRTAVREGDEDAIAELGARSMDGGFFLAVEGKESAHGTTFWRTLHGNYVLESATREVSPSRLQGELLRGPDSLPMAFVVEDQAPVFERVDGELRQVGHAERYARVPLARAGEEQPHVKTRAGHWLSRDHVRIVRRLPRPQDVPDEARWVHVDLASQTLVAYAGDAPRFATLVASGKPPRSTPQGTFQVHYKYVTSTMRGEDEDGPFEVQEVPWTMFYEKNYALHGAYWHDEFGAPRSHGCTNMAPLDARWLFHFVEPDLPDGWQRSADIGSYVVLTGSTEDA